jgi:hypothetical protein
LGLPAGVTAVRAVVGQATGRLYVLPLLLDQMPGTYTLLACNGVTVTLQVEASTPMLKLLRHSAKGVESHDPPPVDSSSNVRLPAVQAARAQRGAKASASSARSASAALPTPLCAAMPLLRRPKACRREAERGRVGRALGASRGGGAASSVLEMGG